MVCDFHTHTIHSDGRLLPVELIRRAVVRGYRAIGLTDHVSPGNLAPVLEALIADCQLAEDHWEVRAIPGVELTHLPPAAIAEVAEEALQVANDGLEAKVKDRTSDLIKEIEERKKVEVALKSAVKYAEDEHEWYAGIVENIGDAISIQDPDYKIIYQNKNQWAKHTHILYPILYFSKTLSEIQLA